MRLRVHIEFLGQDRIKITKFSGQKTIAIKDLMKGNSFDFDSFTMKHASESDFCLSHWDGNGTLAEPYLLIAFKRDYDSGNMEHVGEVDAKNKRSTTIEETLMPPRD